MTNRFISNISQDVNRVLLGLKSRITPFHSRISSDSILSRICLASLIWLFLILGGFSTRAWALVAESNGAPNTSLHDSRTWYGPHASFTLSGDNGNGTGSIVAVKGGQDMYVNWDVEDGCTITVTAIRIKVGHSKIVHSWADCEISINGTYKWSVGTNADFKATADGYNLHNDDNFRLSFSTNADLYWINITYTIKANTPSATPTSIDVTVDPSAKNTVDISSLFSWDGDLEDDHFSIEYGLLLDYDHGNLNDETMEFWADAAGEYYATAQIIAGEDHDASELAYAKITVNRLANTLAVAANSYSCYVDDTIPDIVSNINSDGKITTSSDAPTIAFYSVAKDSIFVPNSSATEFNTTTVTLHIIQAQTSQYESVDKTITLTVKKHDNSITATVPSSTMRLFSTLEDGVTLEATNTDYVGSPIGCEQIRGTGDTLTYDYDEDERTVDFESHQFLGTGTWRFTQPENYKYKAATATVSIKVVNDTCTFYGDYSKSWDLATNWSKKPTDDYASVIIDGELEIASEKQVYSMSFTGRSKAIVSIAPTGGLTVGAGGISGASKDKLILRAGKDGDTKGQTGFLRISPYFDGDMPEASVEMYATAFYDVNGESGSKAVYQCTGAPIDTTEILASNVFTKGSYLYTWNESTSEWTSNRTSLYFTTPFRGFEITQKKIREGWTFTYAGHIVSGHDIKEINLSYTEGKGYNLLANSFTAPIDITSFDSEDFVNAHKTIYILNAGTMNESISPKQAIDAPGKWIGVPVETAEYLAGQGLPRVIAPMQGFWIKANDKDPSKTPQLKLDYSRLVWGVDFSGLKSNMPLRVTKRETEQTEVEKMTISVSSESEKDILFLLESEQFDNAYEDGYDAFKVSSGSLDIYSLEGEDKLGVDATNSIIGTSVGVRTGEETAYTLEFSYVSGEDWALVDMEADEVINIREGTQYTFFAEPNAEINDRFMIVEGENVPAITTGVDNVENGAKVHKFIKDNQLFILKDGVLYNAFGAVVR